MKRRGTSESEEGSVKTAKEVKEIEKKKRERERKMKWEDEEGLPRYVGRKLGEKKRGKKVNVTLTKTSNKRFIKRYIYKTQDQRGCLKTPPTSFRETKQQQPKEKKVENQQERSKKGKNPKEIKEEEAKKRG